MNKEQIVAIIQRGYFTDGDLADALLAELAKVSEPVAVVDANDDCCWADILPDRNVVVGQKLYSHPLPQPDLVDENERKEWALLMNADIEQLREQLATAQASEGELLKSLEKIDEDAKDTCLASVRHLGRIANGAITAHKVRKEK